MEYIDIDAAETFYFLTIRSYEIGVMSWNGLEERLACLARMLDPNSEACKAFRQAVPDALLLESPIDDDKNPEVSLRRDKPQDVTNGTHHAGDQTLPSPPALHLIVHSVSGMKQWTFHEFDRDSFPSIPHGHRFGHKHPKCDPYTGRVYDQHREEVQQERIHIKARIALWQDREFREFSLKAIIWYENEYPNFQFRVLHPHRLPRFRR